MVRKTPWPPSSTSCSAEFNRRPGEDRDPLVRLGEAEGWVPAFAGTTDLLLLRGADGAPQALGGGRHRHVANAERLQRVDKRVADRRHRADGAGFAGALDAERVGAGR